MKRRLIVRLLTVLLLVVMAVSVFHIVKIHMEYKEADTAYEDLQNKYVNTVPDTDEPDETTGGETTGDETEPSASVTDEPEPEPVKISVDFDALMKENGDIVGWIYCEDTPINYPVVQGKDNNEYLRADLKGKYLVSGTIFVDYRNGELGQDRNYIIYGHNMKNSTMFGTLVKYKEQSYYEQHPTLTYLTPDGNYTIELVVGLVVSKTDMLYQANPDAEEYRSYLDDAVRKSTFNSGIEVTDEDRLVVLSTCSYEYDNARYVVIGRLVAAD